MNPSPRATQALAHGIRFPISYVKWMREITKDLPVFGEFKGKRTGNQWHLLRSTLACRCARRGMDIWTLMRLGGWKILGTVLKYVNIARASGDTNPR